jgi:hypothetical protein
VDFAIDGKGPASEAARNAGFQAFSALAEKIRSLPYGRPADRHDPAAVLKEGKGTCSSKHRFLAALAHECGRDDIDLVIGLYEMSAANTPGVAKILADEKLESLPEAHCYLMRSGERFDFTGLAVAGASPFDALIEERTVSPSELNAVKTAYHRRAIEAWARQRGIDPERAWKIRECCIEALAFPST